MIQKERVKKKQGQVGNRKQVFKEAVFKEAGKS